MKRLTAQFGITYFTVLSIAFYISDIAVIILGSAAAVAFIVFMLVAKVRKTVFVPAMALAVVIACTVNIGFTYLYAEPIKERYGDSCHDIKAVLSDDPYKSYHKYYYKLSTTEIDGDKVKTNILLKTSRPIEIEPDDTIVFTSELKTNENQYYTSKGYLLTADNYYLDYDVIEAQSHSLYYYAIMLRRYMSGIFDTLLPEDTSPLAKAIFVGDKYSMSLTDKYNFRYAGASYFIVVSGLHFAVLTLLLYKLLRFIRNRWVVFVIITLFILMYAAVTGFQPSVLRSGIMMLLTMAGRTFRRQTYPLNHLGFTGIVMPFIVSPYGAGDIGLILSFYSTLAILLWATPIARAISLKDKFGVIYHFDPKGYLYKLRNKSKGQRSASVKTSAVITMKKLYNTVASMISVSLAANMLVFPISVFVFREFSLVTLLSSLLLYIPIYLILVLSLAVCVLFPLGPIKFIAVLLSYPLNMLCRFVLWIVETLANLPFSYIRVSSVYFYVWLIVTIILGALVIIFRRRYKMFRFAVLISFIVFVSGWLITTFINLNTFDLDVYSCKDGLCVAVNYKGTLHLLSFDTKYKTANDIAEDLLFKYGRAQTVFCKDEKDLARYNYYMDDKFAISNYLLYDKYNQTKTIENEIRFNKDSKFILDDDLTLTVSVGSGKPICYLISENKDVLIIPRNYKLRNIPENMRRPDAIITAENIDGAEALSCTDLIISASKEKAEEISEDMASCCENIYTTANGDVKYKLR